MQEYEEVKEKMKFDHEELKKKFMEGIDKVAKRMKKVKTKLAVMSGKGGVGKSTVASLLAVHYGKKGYKTGIMDCDFWGSSIPKIFGVSRKRPNLRGEEIEPVYSDKWGIAIMSVQFFLPSEEAPLLWRGPLVSGVIRDLLAKTEWGELDYLIFDLPPGTGDVPLTVLQEIKPNGVILVATPQELSTKIVEKSLHMAKELDTAVVGLIENMSYYECPQCGHREYVFGKGRVAEMASKYRIEFYLELPIDPALTRLCDSGKIELYEIDPFEFFPI
jgi:Mrp family chromosome partitioning ATPase